MGDDPHRPTQLYAASVTAAWQALLATPLLFVYFGALVLANWGYVRLYPLPVREIDGVLAVFAVFVLAVTGFVTALFVESRYSVPPPGEERSRRLYHGHHSVEPDHGLVRRVVRYFGFTLGCLAAMEVMAVLPNLSPYAIVVMVLIAAAGVALALGVPGHGSFRQEVAFGAVVVLCAVPVVRIPATIRDLLGIDALGLPIAAVLFGCMWLPVLGAKTVLAFGPRPDLSTTVAVVVALLLVVGLLLAAPGNAPPTVELDASGKVDFSERRTVEHLGTDNIVHRDVVSVGSLVVENPFLFGRPVPIPDVRACLFTPERRHEMDVLQGDTGNRYRMEDLVPANRRVRVDGRSTRAIGLELKLDGLDDELLDDLGTVPVEVADSCPEESDEPRLVIYTTDGYDPRGPG